MDSPWNSTNIGQVASVPITAYEAVLTVDASGAPIPPTGAAPPPGPGPAPVLPPADADNGRDNPNGDGSINDTLYGATGAEALVALALVAGIRFRRRAAWSAAFHELE